MIRDQQAPIVTLLAPGLVEQDYTGCGALTVYTVRQARESVEALVDPKTRVKILVTCHGIRKFSYVPSEKLDRPPHYVTTRLVFVVAPGEMYLLERFRGILPTDYESRVMDNRQMALDWLTS